ncbi:MAG: hypothetical protein PSV23_01410 [Brevundimonas sp.]|uniref:hypothetical protein n=1 Tax=Brevundimonas sp. TaxID=1871086 RepID=UPI0024886906|nr:hypothetical protein [Brevundimonas sp.]MDI1325433.1 hypothetical protein [Brevundimonas sp.]
MTGSDIGTWIGTAFSILGAAIAVRQARRAKSAASQAVEMRDEIAEKHASRELSGLDGILAAACKAMDKYGPGRRASSLRGTTPDSDADAVRAFTAELDRHREMLASTFGQPCDDVRDRLHRLLGEFGAAATVSDRLPKGCEIYLEITTFSGNMKKALDGKVFGQADAPVK